MLNPGGEAEGEGEEEEEEFYSFAWGATGGEQLQNRGPAPAAIVLPTLEGVSF